MKIKHNKSENKGQINKNYVNIVAILIIFVGTIYILYKIEATNMEIKYINPDTMAKPQGYSHGISVTGNHKTIYVGRQNAIDANGNLVGKDNLKQQSEQVLANIEKILENDGAKLENVVKLNIHILQGQNPQEGFQAFQERWKDNENFPTITVVFVAGFVNPDWLVEIDAVAVVTDSPYFDV